MHISIIIPVFNAEHFVGRLLDSISAIVPKYSFDVCFVDNRSTDLTATVIKNRGYRVLRFDEYASSYASRNLGITETVGDVIAFTDADCRVDANWLNRGIACLENRRADIAAGRVSFEFRNPDSGWEVRDALTNMDNEASVRRGYAKTANLFVRRRVFDRMGLFNSKAQSGEDAEWTGRAKRHGYALVYCENAVVYHPTRTARETINKAVRVGIGYVNRSQTRRKGPLSPDAVALFTILRGVLPPNPFALNQLLRSRHWSFAGWKLLIPAWIASIFTSIGAFCGVIVRLGRE